MDYSKLPNPRRAVHDEMQLIVEENPVRHIDDRPEPTPVEMKFKRVVVEQVMVQHQDGRKQLCWRRQDTGELIPESVWSSY